MKKFIVFLMLLATLFPSCKKDEGPHPGPPDPGGEYTLVSAELHTVANEVRLHQYIEDTAEGVEEGRIATPFMSERNLKIRVVVRRHTAEGLKYAYQTLTFRKVSGENRATFTGNLITPKGPGNMEIAAILLAEEGDGGEEFMQVHNNSVDVVRTAPINPILTVMETLPGGRKKVRTRIPYVSEWRPMTIVNKKIEVDNGSSDLRKCLIFRPSGTLLRLRFTYSGTQPRTISAIRIKSNVLVRHWNYCFTRNSLTGTADGNLVQGYVDNDSQIRLEELYNFPQPVTLSSSNPKSPWYYLWVMSRKPGLPPPSGGFETKISVLETNASERQVFSSTRETLKLGAIPIEVPGCSDFPFGKLPLDFVAPKNLAKVAGAWKLQSDNTIPNSPNNQIFPFADVLSFRHNAPPQGRLIGTDRYYIPEDVDMWSLFLMGENKLNVSPMGTWFNVRQDRMRVGGPGGRMFQGDSQGVYRSYWYRHTDGVVYAVRLTGRNNCHVLAYRYRFVGGTAPNPSNSYVEVSSRYVGRDASLGIGGGTLSQSQWQNILQTHVCQPGFWTPGPGRRFSQTVTLPTIGAKQLDGATGNDLFIRWGDGRLTDGVYGVYWISEPGANYSRYLDFGTFFFEFPENRVGLAGHLSTVSAPFTAPGPPRASVRLFKDLRTFP